MKLSAGTHSSKLWDKVLSPPVLVKTAILFYCLFTVMVVRLPFSGDQVTLISAPAVQIFSQGITHWELPEEMPTGHPVFYPALVATLWAVFGKSLWVVHFLSLIGVLLLLTQFYILLKNRVEQRGQTIALLLFIFNPVLLAQVAAMSADVWLTAMFFTGLNAILTENRKKLAIAIIVSLCISLRGWIAVTIFFCIEIFNHPVQFRALLRRVLFYVVCIIPAVLYILWEYTVYGFWLVPSNGSWSSGRGTVTGIYLGGKAFEYAIRLVEFGMIIPVITLLYAWIINRKDFIRQPVHRMLIITLFVFAIFLVPFKNPVLIRYLLPAQLLLIVAFGVIGKTVIAERKMQVLTGITSLVFIAHHFFAYPQMKNSVFEYSWGDGSLAHLSYFTFRQEGRTYIDSMHIDCSEVYTAFPDYRPFSLTDLTNDTRQYGTLDTTKLGNYRYVLYSNIMNEITKPTEDRLKTQWKILRSWYSYPVEYILFENPAAGDESGYR